jgi:hypothetical protein
VVDIDGITLPDINSLIERTGNTIRGVSDEHVIAELRGMKDNLSEMRVALAELENLEDKHSRGGVTSDTYFDRRMKIVRDFYSAKDEIPSKVIPSVADCAQSPDEKSGILKFKELIRSKKEFIAMAVDFLLTVAKVFAIT